MHVLLILLYKLRQEKRCSRMLKTWIVQESYNAYAPIPAQANSLVRRRMAPLAVVCSKLASSMASPAKRKGRVSGVETTLIELPSGGQRVLLNEKSNVPRANTFRCS